MNYKSMVFFIFVAFCANVKAQDRIDSLIAYADWKVLQHVDDEISISLKKINTPLDADSAYVTLSKSICNFICGEGHDFVQYIWPLIVDSTAKVANMHEKLGFIHFHYNRDVFDRLDKQFGNYGFSIGFLHEGLVLRFDFAGFHTAKFMDKFTPEMKLYVSHSPNRCILMGDISLYGILGVDSYVKLAGEQYFYDSFYNAYPSFFLAREVKLKALDDLVRFPDEEGIMKLKMTWVTANSPAPKDKNQDSEFSEDFINALNLYKIKYNTTSDGEIMAEYYDLIKKNNFRQTKEVKRYEKKTKEFIESVRSRY